MSSGDLNFTRIFSSRYSVEKCAFSPNGRLLATCFADFSVRVFTIEEGDHAPSSISIQLRGIIRDHKSNVWCTAFSKDSALLCTCSSDKTARIWDVQTLECRFTFSAHSNTVWCCGFAPEGSIVATGSSDLTVKLWKWQSGEVVCDLTDYEDAIDCIDFTTTQRNNTTLLCTACRDCTIKVWDITTHSSSSHQISPICLLLYKSTRGVIGFCKFIHRLREHSDVCTTLSFNDNSEMSPSLKEDDGVQSCHDLLVIGGENNNIVVWDVNSLHNVFDDQTHPTNQRTNTVVDPNTGDATPQIADETSQPSSEFSYAHSHAKVLPVTVQPTTNVNGSDLNDDRTLSPEMHSPQDNATQHGERETLDEGDFKSLSEQPESTFPPMLVLRGHTNIVWDCCSMHAATKNSGLLLNSIKGKKPADILISCSGDRTIRLWDLADGSCLSVCTMPGEDKESQILTCSLCSSQRLLAIGLYNGTLLLGFEQCSIK